MRRPGPRRPEGYPAGPDEVRRAVLDVAGRLFAERGVDAVALRDVADAANVHHTLIARYIGNRETLIRAVFDDLSEQVASAVAENPLAGQGYGLETAMGRWVRVAGSLAISGRPLVGQSGFNPVVAMAETLEASYGQDPQAARLRAAQIVAAALGWRLFEDYLVEAGAFDDIPLATLRDEHLHTLRRLGATPWPSPPDPPTHTS